MILKMKEQNKISYKKITDITDWKFCICDNWKTKQKYDWL